MDNRKRRKKKRGLKVLLGILLAVFVLCSTVLAGYEIMKKTGKDSLYGNAATKAPQLTSQEQESTQDNADYYYRNGKTYQYNEDIITILCMGIDKKTESFEKQETSGKSGQADSIFLLVLNPDTGKMEMISVSRDAMTEIQNYDYQGNYIGDSVNHLGLAYAYGDGEEKSCELMVDAVSNLFFDLPIQAYCAINLTAAEKLNEAVGGVTVTVPEDLTKQDPELKEGATVKLEGDQVLTFIQSRDSYAQGSNNKRMERQKQYALNFLSQAKSAMKKDVTLPVTLYHELSENMVTNINLDNAVYLATLMADMELTEEGFYTVQGEVKQGSVYEEFYVDDEKLQEMILDIFYKEVPAEKGSE